MRKFMMVFCALVMTLIACQNSDTKYLFQNTSKQQC